MLVLAALPHLAWAGVSEKAYDRAVDLVARLYLYPEDLRVEALLHGAAAGLADEVPWLLVEPQGNAVFLRHGDGREIGEVSVASLATLPDALRALERLVVESGHALDGVDARLQILTGMTRGLDRYSRVLEGEGLERFDVRLKGTLVGIGATLRIQEGQLRIVDLVPDGPAAQVGILSGDVVDRIDGVSTVNMPLREATRRIRGDDGSVIALVVRRGEQVLELAFPRAEVVVANVYERALEDGVGYVRITHFSQRTVENLTAALATLAASGGMARGLVIDLRGNTGGSMKEAARSADQFLTEGMLLRTAGPNGGQVQNLQGRMDAVAAGDEPPVPIVVLMDRRTASGSEILAGALLQLDRAVLIGTRSYGKGTVQKIYNLDEEARLKLTVAQYLLAGDRSIADGGLPPDAALAQIELDGLGVHYEGWGLSVAGRSREEIIPVVRERYGWRGIEDPPTDVALELARRAVIGSAGPGRADVLASLIEAIPTLRAEQEGHLIAALEARGLDWSPAEASDARPLQADVKVTSSVDPEQPGRVEVNVELVNRGDVPLHRAEVELVCDTFWPWSGRVVPLGRVEPGASASGLAVVRLSPGVGPREDAVGVRLHADGRESLWAGEEVFRAPASEVPRVGLSARLGGEGGDRVAEITVRNLSEVALDRLEVYFAAPGDLDVELIDRAALLDVAPRGEGRIDLAVRLGEALPEQIPMHLIIESPAYGVLAEWPVDLSRSGDPTRLEAPRIEASLPLSAPVGPFQVHAEALDDGTIAHAVVYVDGHKVAWAAGGSDHVRFVAEIELGYGVNRVQIVSKDDQGLSGARTVYVRGEAPVAVDAAPEFDDLE